MNLNWNEYSIGQAYDGAASMREAYKGFQAIIKKEKRDFGKRDYCETFSANRYMSENTLYKFLNIRSTVLVRNLIRYFIF